jgi:hypothetical protein
LKTDVTVIFNGDNEFGRCDIQNWHDIIAISTGNSHTVGLRIDGTVVAVGDNSNGQCNTSSWNNIVAISAGYGYTVGLKDDGTVVAIGSNYAGRCNTKYWNNIGYVDDNKLSYMRQQAERETKGLCLYCGGQLGGILTKKCVSCGKLKKVFKYKENSKANNENLDNAIKCFEKGYGYFQSKSYSLAIDNFTQAINLYSDYTDARWLRSIACKEKGNFNLAIKDCSWMIEHSPFNTERYLERAEIYIKIGDFKNAINDLEDALLLDPDDSRAKNNLEKARQNISKGEK